ncbi:pyridoxamine 5'-phosphate oxidase family protein [Coralloluteibacterium stylophorae]|uniref:Pyridoxamine 5'-phosphate oxidase family protein n=1 Tax=Coralloluteibacterium stylophorae TaxID=1776034 RepID=A0AAP2C8H5_9GAMM|nr:pyridoxamine 5'-phosphate oxidase family protein [Coralloluteibacterium stylophorae]MBS7455839.1 pyridoxamine 5'-phosphate oxidase family protein [Coralloluteibacterium stylophorae]
MENNADHTRSLHELGELIDGIDVAMLTTRTASGGMVSRPLQTLRMEPSGDLLFFTSASSGKVDELTQHPEVNLGYAEPDKQVYVSVRGTATIERDRALIDDLWTPMAKAFFPEGKDDPDLVVLRVRIESADYWTGSGNFVGRAIGFARALAGEGSSAMGEHGHIEPR